MLIRQAELDGILQDVRVDAGRIAAIASALPRLPGEIVLEARGGALLPGLHDHHAHLLATAAALVSVHCGPPHITDRRGLAAALHKMRGDGWLRGIGYHDSIGAIDRAWLDRHGPARPIRIQHRSGRMWVFNSRAAAALGGGVPEDGRLIDGDAWLSTRLAAVPPDLAPVGAQLARYGVTGVTEVTPRNGLADYERLANAGLPQRLLVMGKAELVEAAPLARARRGALKLHYHDHDLPDLEALAAEIAASHAAGRPVAAHCVTTAELLLTLAALEIAGAHPGDRIEHAAVALPEAVRQIAELGVTVVTQPHFLAERHAAYRAEVDPEDHRFLYRLRGFLAAGIRLAAGSDAPFGGLNPWAAMEAAVCRPEGFGDDEALTPEQALALYTGEADDPGGSRRRVAVGEEADLCLLGQSWAVARENLRVIRPCACVIAGELVYASASTSPQESAVAAGIRRIDSAI